MKTVNAIVEKAKDGSFSVYTKVDDLPYGLNGNGETLKQAKADFMQGYEAIKEAYAAEGEDFEDVEFAFTYDLPSFLQDYAYAFTLAGLQRITGVNQKQLGHYISGYRRPSAKTTARIERRLHEFSRILTSVHLI